MRSKKATGPFILGYTYSRREIENGARDLGLFAEYYRQGAQMVITDYGNSQKYAEFDELQDGNFTLSWLDTESNFQASRRRKAQEESVYIVSKREVWVQMVEVDATSKEEALRLVENGGGLMLDDTLEYSHDLSTDLWTVEEE